MADQFRYSIDLLAPDLAAIEYVGFMGELDTGQVSETAKLLDAASTAVGLCYTVDQFLGFHRGQLKSHAELFLRRTAKIRG
ncbi:MAG TPA: hypothetical protein VGO62_18620, partial [Myxococcota bacterium]